ncbi:UNVERIFIED_CONTAM: hypothetical protein GTU68_024989 [Idotea baltica]|nr:hypothetical protein [Idotea baltica]
MRWIARKGRAKGKTAGSGSLFPRELCNFVRSQSKKLCLLTDAEIARASEDLRERGCALAVDSLSARNALLQDAFALSTEAVRRSTGKTFYDVQLHAGSVLASGDLAEMATGEGKTLVTLLPVYAAVVGGHNVHVATTNSYLADRDCEELRPAFDALGVSLALLPEENDDVKKRAAYDCDVTYGTGYEFGFDYLRDQTERARPTLVQSARAVTIVDEIDSVLIDEANTPLVISFFSDDKADDSPYRLAAATADAFDQDQDYELILREAKITLTKSGLQKAQDVHRGRPDLLLQRPWRIYIEQALRAKHLLHRDIDYVLQDDGIALVDQQTGRIFPERKWRDGLHQAIEFKEGVELTAETNSFARISRQRFFQMYDHATGMTGTATDAASEFHGFFGLNVVPIPLNRPSKRKQLPGRFFVDDQARMDAMIKDVASRHRLRQPVLLGTRTIQQSLQIGDSLKAAGLPYQILNGLQDASEAEIVAEAGQAGRITVATNMAGRGTDIKLTDEGRSAGGLHVVVAEPNRSCRVDRQLIGRAARQGDPGSCQFFVSATDDLLMDLGPALVRKIRSSANRSGESLRDHIPDLLLLQRRAERVDFAKRRHLLQQEFWVEGILKNLVGTDT